VRVTVAAAHPRRGVLADVVVLIHGHRDRVALVRVRVRLGWPHG
jgi:hypothetical protein